MNYVTCHGRRQATCAAKTSPQPTLTLPEMAGIQRLSGVPGRVNRPSGTASAALQSDDGPHRGEMIGVEGVPEAKREA